VPVSRERRAVYAHAPVYVAGVVEHGAAAGAPPHKRDGRGEDGGRAGLLRVGSAAVGQGAWVLQKAEVGFQPWVLVSADHDARPVGVQEEEFGSWRCFFEEVVLDGQIQVRVP